MMRFLRLLVSTTMMLGLVALPVLAQTAPSPTPPAAPASPGALPPGGPAGGTATLPKEKQVEGPVKRVDPMGRTVQVGWFFGIFRTTLEANDDTQIMAEGRKGSLFEIREGAKVKASYEARDGKNVAKSIEVLPEQQEERATAPAGLPPGVGARMESPGAPASPAPGRPSSQ